MMKDNGVAIDDLYSVMLPQQEKLQQPFDVHFTADGSELLAESVAKSIEADLPAAKPQ